MNEVTVAVATTGTTRDATLRETEDVIRRPINGEVQFAAQDAIWGMLRNAVGDAAAAATLDATLDATWGATEAAILALKRQLD